MRELVRLLDRLQPAIMQEGQTQSAPDEKRSEKRTDQTVDGRETPDKSDNGRGLKDEMTEVGGPQLSTARDSKAQGKN